MEPKPNDLIRCHLSGEYQEYHKYTKYISSGLAEFQLLTKVYWNKVRPDGSYNNYIMDTCFDDRGTLKEEYDNLHERFRDGPGMYVIGGQLMAYSDIGII